jgi:hypothetical protein
MDSQNLMFGIMKHFMSIVRDIATAKQGNGGGDMLSVNKALGEMMIGNAKSQMALVNELVATRAGLNPDDDGDEDDPQSMTQWILWIWRNFGELVLSGGKAIQAAARAKIEQDPRFQQLLQDQEQFGTAYAALVEEAGEDKVKKLLTTLGVPIPEAPTATGADVGGTQPGS